MTCHLLTICCNSETEFVLRHEQARKGKRRETVILKKVSEERVEHSRPSIPAKWRL